MSIAFRGSIYFDEQRPVTNYDELDRRLRNGELRFAMEIPPAFEQDLQRGRQPEVVAFLDAAIPFRAETDAQLCAKASMNSIRQALRETKGLPTGRGKPIKFNVRALVQPGLQEHLRHGSGRHHASADSDPMHADRAQRCPGEGTRLDRQFLCRPGDQT